MNDLLSTMKISSFEPLLKAYVQVCGSFDAIDGGAGSGLTAKQIKEQLAGNSCVYAFEPFPGNHRFFEDDKRITLIKKALGDENKNMTFRVPSVVSEGSEWGKRGMAGYSSVGHLVDGASQNPSDIVVEAVRGDSAIPDDADIGFIKLDLQGGELNALKGLGGILDKTKFMWIEFTGQGQEGLLEYLMRSSFLVFDSSYVVVGNPTELGDSLFERLGSVFTLSVGMPAWRGFRRFGWTNYEREFMEARSKLGIWTDLACVNSAYLKEFFQVLTLL